MSDPKDAFDINNNPDPFGPYSRDETKIEEIAGVKVVTRQIYVEQVAPDGSRNIFTHSQYLCQGCGAVYVIIGQNGALTDNMIMCAECIRRARRQWFWKPIWSIFIAEKANEDKKK